MQFNSQLFFSVSVHWLSLLSVGQTTDCGFVSAQYISILYPNTDFSNRKTFCWLQSNNFCSTLYSKFWHTSFLNVFQRRGPNSWPSGSHTKSPVLLLEVKLLTPGLFSREYEPLGTCYLNDVLIPVAPSNLSSEFSITLCEDWKMIMVCKMKMAQRLRWTMIPMLGIWWRMDSLCRQRFWNCFEWCWSQVFAVTFFFSWSICTQWLSLRVKVKKKTDSVCCFEGTGKRPFRGKT